MNDDLESMWSRVDLTISTSQKKVTELLKQGREQYDAGKYNDAITTLLKCVNEDPENLESHYYLGLLYTKTDDLNKAIVHFNEITLSKYKYIHLYNVHSILGYIYIRQRDYETAKGHLSEIIQQNKNDLKALSMMGYIHYKKNNFEKAKDYYTEVIRQDGNNANAYNSLGMIYIDGAEDIEKGISFCKRALEIAPDTPAYLDSIGWGYFKMQKESQAMEYLKKAFELAPDNQEIKHHLKAILNI